MYNAQVVWNPVSPRTEDHSRSSHRLKPRFFKDRGQLALPQCPGPPFSQGPGSTYIVRNGLGPRFAKDRGQFARLTWPGTPFLQGPKASRCGPMALHPVSSRTGKGTLQHNSSEIPNGGGTENRHTKWPFRLSKIQFPPPDLIFELSKRY